MARGKGRREEEMRDGIVVSGKERREKISWYHDRWKEETGRRDGGWKEETRKEIMASWRWKEETIMASWRWKKRRIDTKAVVVGPHW